MLSQDNGNKYNTKYCGVGKIALWILDIEYSIEVELVSEDCTSKDT